MALTEETDPYLLPAGPATQRLARARWRRFLVLGDSIAEGMGEPSPGYPSSTWFERIRAVLSRAQPDLVFLNVARRDARAAEIRANQLPAALDFKPDLVAIVAGGNDLFGRAFDPDAVEAELDAIVDDLRGAGATVILVTLMDIVSAVPALAGGLMDRLPVLNDRIRRVSARHGALLLDAFIHPMCADRDVYSADLKHPTMRGHAILGTEALTLLAAEVD